MPSRFRSRGSARARTCPLGNGLEQAETEHDGRRARREEHAGGQCRVDAGESVRRHPQLEARPVGELAVVLDVGDHRGDLGLVRGQRTHLQLAAEPGHVLGASVAAQPRDAGAEEHAAERLRVDRRPPPSVTRMTRFARGVVEHRTQPAVERAGAFHVLHGERDVAQLVPLDVLALQVGRFGAEGFRGFVEDGGRAAGERGVSPVTRFGELEIGLELHVRRALLERHRVGILLRRRVDRVVLVGTGENERQEHGETRASMAPPGQRMRTVGGCATRASGRAGRIRLRQLTPRRYGARRSGPRGGDGQLGCRGVVEPELGSSRWNERRDGVISLSCARERPHDGTVHASCQDSRRTTRNSRRRATVRPSGARICTSTR